MCQLLGLVFRLTGLHQLTVQILLPKVSCDGIRLFQKTLDRRRLDNPVAVFIPSGVGAGNLACILPTEACGVMHYVCQYVGKNVGVYFLRFKIRTGDARAGALARRHFGVLNQHLVECCVIIAHIVADSLRVNRLVRLPQPVIRPQAVLEVRRCHVGFRVLICADNARDSICRSARADVVVFQKTCQVFAPAVSFQHRKQQREASFFAAHVGDALGGFVQS